jgi:HSP20 family protein
MAIVRWEPFRDLSTFQSVFAPAPSTQTLRRWMPAMDLVESGDHYVLTADLPGLSSDDVNIDVQDRVLTISGERKSKSETTKDGFRRVERAYGSFKRSVTLPEGVDAEAVEATFENGVLEVSIPKPAARKPLKIAIAPKTIEAETPAAA